MKTTTIGLVMLFSVSTVIFNGCKKDNDIEYQPKGSYGNTNITSSTTITLNSWSSDSNDGNNYIFSKSFSWSAITQAIKDNGVVMAYGQNGSNWVVLPYTETYTGYSQTMAFQINTGTIQFELLGYDANGSPSTSDFDGTVVRIVAIGAAGMKKLSDNNVDTKNYKAVTECLSVN